MKYFIYCCFLIIFSCFSSCDLWNVPPDLPPDLPPDNVVFIQFYANPQKFNPDADGHVVSSITINGLNYQPKNVVGNCAEMLPVPYASTNPYGSEYFEYTINMKNYKSLDALMQGIPFTWEHPQGVIYVKDLQPGCNTLEVIENTYGGPQLYGLKVN